MQPRVNFIGCGQLGKTLGSLWQSHGTLQIGDILTRSLNSAEAASRRIGAGSPIDRMPDMQRAEIYLIACKDNDITLCSQQLAASGLLRKGDVVFHCSGAQSSVLLQACKAVGAYVASVHPIKSFADIELAIESFAGTFCGVEGDEQALEILTPLFTEIKANLLPIQAEHKILYHAASVIASNYLVSLQEMSVLTFEKAGVSRDQAMAILQPIVTGTVDNIFRLGTAEALTGPIARGDHEVVSEQLEALRGWNEDFATLYRILGKFAIPLAKTQGNTEAEKMASLSQLLD